MSPTLTPTLDRIADFVNALKLFLDESDIVAIETLANRISPFRIEFRPVAVGEAISFRPELVLQQEKLPRSAMPPCG